MTRLRRAVIIGTASIVIPIALGMVCGIALDPLGLGITRPAAATQRMAMATCGVGAIASAVIVGAVLATELIVLALTALLDLVVARWLPKGTRRFAIYRACTGITGGLIGGGLIGLPFAQVAAILPALLIGPLIGLALNLPVGRRISPLWDHATQQPRTPGCWGLAALLAGARRAFRIWMACIISGAAVGLVLASAREASAGTDLRTSAPSALSALGVAFATIGVGAALSAWSGFLAVSASTLISAGLEGLARHANRFSSADRRIVTLIAGSLAGGASAGSGVWFTDEASIVVAATALGFGAGLASAWPRARR